MRRIARVLRTVIVLVTVAAVLFGLPALLGYRSKGIGGALAAPVLAGTIYYWVWHIWIGPLFGKMGAQLAADFEAYEASATGTVSVSKRRLGQDHEFAFRCKRCDQHQRVWHVVDPMYSVVCPSCGTPHRIRLV